ncbi:FAS1-like dehydratase domain-containing protein [Microbaculum sp. FT89]|uniref:FAS1-like dehydratase domain-containing protein n=1 Tax=Microbaculum sp. FT89 TaxID=3447298 RepID=UPI003F535FDE
MPLDIDHLRQWVGSGEEARDLITPQLVKGYRAMLDEEPGEPAPGEAAPLSIHWCLAPPVAPMSALGRDGHPARGDFLPPVPLPRRMWAGGEIEWIGDLRVGDRVTRRSTIEDVTAKWGRTGELCFVVVRHLYETERGTAISERHDVVFREDGAGAAAPRYAEEAAELERVVDPTPTLLFRYSALTYNGHRIHYDRPYATEVEGYPGLVVHGPLQSTLLQYLARDMNAGVTPRRMRYRGVGTLFDGSPFRVCGRRLSDGTAALWTCARDGRLAMTATATW